MDDDELGARDMLAELDLPVAQGKARELLDAFGDAVDPLLRFIVAAQVASPNSGPGEQTFAIFHLLARGISDLLAGAHLVSHCYLTQAYSVLRPVLDSCDLVELFAKEPDQAAVWVNTDQGHKHFAPGKVRELLGSPRHDPVHSHFSEAGSHPRFRGAQLSGGMMVNSDDPTDQTALFNVGPMWPEHPAVLHAWLFALHTVAHLGGRFHHLVEVTDDATTRLGWANAYLASLDACARGVDLAVTELGEGQEMVSEYTTIRTALLAWIEGEEAG
jgi:hypothetical protein